MLAIIPARGGSKGLPRKNLKELKGKPLIAYTIEAALNADCIDRVVVSTDSEEIAEVAKSFGAEVPFLRPDALAQDNSNAIDTYIYTINQFASQSSDDIDHFCVLQPTSPLRIAKDIDQAGALFIEKDADSVISYCQEHHPISWHKYLTSDGRLIDTPMQSSLKNRQELRPSYYPNGAIYIFKTEIIRAGKYMSDKTYAYLMPRSRSIDIDTYDDFKYAEFLMNG